MTPTRSRTIPLVLALVLALGLVPVQSATAQLASPDSRLFIRDTADGLPFAILGRVGATRGFGEAMAVGDFNCDGIEDLAIGAPDANANNVVASGQIVIAYGGALGLRSNDGIGLSQSSPNMPGGSEVEDFFGFALAAGKLTDDNCDDLVVGTPREDFENPIPILTLTDAGSVTFLQGRSTGMTGVGAFNVPFEEEFAFGAADGPQTDSRFGASLAIANVFSAGGTFSELIVGIPGFDAFPGFVINSGAIDIRAADSFPLRRRVGRFFDEDCCGQQNQSFDFFGSALVSGNFDGDGLPDLAIGIPFQTVNGVQDAGSVTVLYGGASPIGSGGWINFNADTPGIPVTSQLHGGFGLNLAAGDFDGDGDSDLVVRSEARRILETEDAVIVRNGRSGGLNGFDATELWGNDQVGLPAPASNDFGRAFAVGDFNGDGFDDLATGAPLTDTSGVADSGAVVVLYGTAFGLELTGRQIWHKGSTGIPGELGVDEQFGAGLAAGDFNDDGVDDLVVAIPKQILGTTPRGGVLVIYGQRRSDTLFANGFESGTQAAASVGEAPFHVD